jgi:hypothetical protein
VSGEPRRPAPPRGPSPTRTIARGADLKHWIKRHRSTYTDTALGESAVSVGYTRAEFDGALALVDADLARAEADRQRREAVKPVRDVTRRVILISYGLVWLLFAVAYLTNETLYGAGQVAQGILTVALGISLIASWDWTRRRRPDPANLGRAFIVLLSLPMVLLLVVGGLCFPFVPR